MSMQPQLTMPPMPALWDKTEMIVGFKALSGALAHWAVFQSPYTAPENLGAAVEQFMEKWPHGDYVRLSSNELSIAVRENIAQCPLILAWNEPKIEGAVNEYGFASVSRYDSIKPDYDFIDLDALTHNICHEITLWAQVESAQDAVRSLLCRL